MRLRAATPGDLTAIMEIERLPGFEKLVGRSTQAEHEARLSDLSHAYLLGLDDRGAVMGFAILRDIGSGEGSVYLKRIAVRDPGQGQGSALLAAVIDWAFAPSDVIRFHLDHFSDNDPAHRAYEKCGLVQEGVLRQAHRLPDGRYADLTVMSILRSEWQARQKSSARAAERSALTPLQQKLRVRGLASVDDARQKLLAPLGADVKVDASPDHLERLWNDVSRLHRHAPSATEAGNLMRGAETVGALIRQLAPEIDDSQTVDLIFSHRIEGIGSFVGPEETFTGAVACDLGSAIAMIDVLERQNSAICRDPIVIVAPDFGWSIWVELEEIVFTRPR